MRWVCGWGNSCFQGNGKQSLLFLLQNRFRQAFELLTQAPIPDRGREWFCIVLPRISRERQNKYQVKKMPS
mgnify:CR=1 FL=1